VQRADWVWFRKHPDRRYYARPTHPEEGEPGYTVIKRARPWALLRVNVPTASGQIDDKLPEPIYAELFDLRCPPTLRDAEECLGRAWRAA
jgi:hypothetical protein